MVLKPLSPPKKDRHIKKFIEFSIETETKTKYRDQKIKEIIQGPMTEKLELPLPDKMTDFLKLDSIILTPLHNSRQINTTKFVNLNLFDRKAGAQTQ